jgi:hypothetical protein
VNRMGLVLGHSGSHRSCLWLKATGVFEEGLKVLYRACFIYAPFVNLHSILRRENEGY